MDYNIDVGFANILSNMELEHSNTIYKKHNGSIMQNFGISIFVNLI